MRVPSYQRSTDIGNTKLKILSTINQYSACLYKDKNYRQKFYIRIFQIPKPIRRYQPLMIL